MKNNNHNVAKPAQDSVKGGRAEALIRKISPRDLIIRRMREYFLYSKLRSLLPLQPLEPSTFRSTTQLAIEYELPPHEIPSGDSDEENANVPTFLGAAKSNIEDEEDGDGDEVCYYDDGSSDDEDDVTHKTFVPSIKIKRMDNALLISTVVLKNVALSSALFGVLEEEKLDILYENQYRTETKVSHTIQVKVPSEYDPDELERKLQAWARTGKHTQQ